MTSCPLALPCDAAEPASAELLSFPNATASQAASPNPDPPLHHVPQPSVAETRVTLPPLHIVTPLIAADIAGRHVQLKLENLQPSRSFKLRGIGLLCQQHAADGCRRLVCSSAGNAGYAVAWAGRALGLPVTVVLPESTPAFMRSRIAALGAGVIAHGQVWDQANAHALLLANEEGSAYIPPFDHPLIWRGHASLVEELAQQCEQPPDALLLAVGGGGLLLGVLEGLQRVGWTKTRVIAVEPEHAASLAASLKQDTIVELDRPQSVASSLCVRRIAPALLEACRGRDVTPLSVSDKAATRACARLADEQGLVVEPACGAALAPLYEDHPAVEGMRSIVAIVCGGMVVQLEQLTRWLQQAP